MSSSETATFLKIPYCRTIYEVDVPKYYAHVHGHLRRLSFELGASPH